MSAETSSPAPTTPLTRGQVEVGIRNAEAMAQLRGLADDFRDDHQAGAGASASSHNASNVALPAAAFNSDANVEAETEPPTRQEAGDGSHGEFHCVAWNGKEGVLLL